MGIYLNPDNEKFRVMKSKDIYVDKSLYIEKIYQYATRKNEYICMSRPRRFGKSTDAYMLAAYFSKGCDSAPLFDDLNISRTSMYKNHLNQHKVIFINMQYFYDMSESVTEMKEILTEELIDEINQIYHISLRRNKLPLLFNAIYRETNDKFIFIIDEWDCVLRDKDALEIDKKAYLTFVNSLFKDQVYIEFVYMTGILPIKKYSNQSALNSFDEITMLHPALFGEYMGFSEDEVKNLCNQYHMDFEEMKVWYNGYRLENNISIYNPRSIIDAISEKKYGNYWSKTSAFENLRSYIDRNLDGVREAVIELLAGGMVKIDPDIFNNDASELNCKDDVLTFLVHLGYLGYDAYEKKVYIPNKEVSDSFASTMKKAKWQEAIYFLENSDKLFEATWNQDEEKVAYYVEKAHQEVSILQYNDENALAYVIYLAYLTAKDYYIIVRELPSGNGYADIAFIPIDDKPAMIVELKWNKNVHTAIDQIIDRQYPAILEHYKDNLLLVGISYNKDSESKDYKKHTCEIIKLSD